MMETELLNQKPNTAETRSNQLAPKLRFRGFEDSWSLDNLGNVTKVTSGGTPSRANKNYWNGDIPWISTSLIDFNVIQKAEEYITQEGVDNSSAKIFPKGTILMAMYGQGKTRGKVAVLGIAATTNQACAAIIVEDKIYNDYLFQNLAGRYDEVRDLSNEGGQQNLSGGIIKGIRFSFPTLPEQQKIASFLSAVDEKIQQLTRKKELLEQYKKGVMQNLFSGKLRFKGDDGKDFPDWEEKRLGDVAEVKRGAASQHLNYVSDAIKGIRLLRINDFLNDGAVYVENTEEMKRYTVRTNDLLIAGTGATAGIIFIVPEKFNNLTYSYNAPRIRVNNAYHTFVYYYLKSNIILKQQQRLFVGNAQPFLDTDAMRGFKIDLPSIEEQQKIASYLSSIDTKIESVANQITQTQIFKKGLLQQMFV